MMCRAVLDKMETLIDANQDAKSGNIAKKISLLQAMQFWRDAWDSISKEAIQNCWKNGNLEEYSGKYNGKMLGKIRLRHDIPHGEMLVRIAINPVRDDCRGRIGRGRRRVLDWRATGRSRCVTTGRSPI